MAKEPTTIGLSDTGHRKLQSLKEEGHFREMTDAYRFSIALALAHGVKPVDVKSGKKTIFNVGTLDPDGSVYAAISALQETDDGPIWRVAEGLAEWGVEELCKLSKNGDIVFGELLLEAETLLKE
jgi:hypothetical protein